MGQVEGFAACLVAGVFFGSNFIPVKQYEVGDGVFFQFVMCLAIWLIGLLTVAMEDELTFHPMAMIGGALWCTGNILCVQVIKLIGMSMGLMVWGVVNSLAGWACAKFGLFGLDKSVIKDPALNYIGLVLTVMSLSLFAHVKTSVGDETSAPGIDQVESPRHTHQGARDYGSIQGMEDDNLSTPLALAHTTQQMLDDHMAPKHQNWEDRLNPRSRFIIGFAGSVVCGILFGVNFVPPLAEKAASPSNDQNLLDYVFSHFCGILVTSTVFLLGYCVYKKNKPVVDGRLILPATACGLGWGIAQVSWFLALQELEKEGGMVIANPIITTLPSAVAGAWGIGVFGEIQGKQNILLFCSGLMFAVTGVVLVALSAEI